jgi:hypothetical protein
MHVFVGSYAQCYELGLLMFCENPMNHFHPSVRRAAMA